jgi:hypothetical protein
MKKKIAVCMICTTAVALVSCKPTTSITTESQSTYEELRESIDMESDVLTMQLTDMARIDASVTPESKYKEGLGIYEFTKEHLDMGLDGFIEQVNRYWGKEEVSYEDSGQYALEVTPADEDLPECRIEYIDDMHAEFFNEPEISHDYLTFVTYLIEGKYPILSDSSEGVFDRGKELIQMFSGQFQNMDAENSYAVSIVGEEGYRKIEDIYGRIDVDDYDGRIVSTLFQMGGGIAEERKDIYGIECYEMVGNEGIPLLPQIYASYVNTEQKTVPETSRQSYGDEVWTPCDNVIRAAFDGDGNLQALYINKDIRVESTPVRVEPVINLQEVTDFIYEKVKTVKTEVVVYSIQLYYTGVVVEEDGELEDYIYPVWEIRYYDSNSKSDVLLYLNAVTGKELIE